MTKKALDEKYSYQIDEYNVVHLFRREVECQEFLTNSLLSAIFKIESLEKENAELKEINEGYCRSRDRLISIGFPNFKDCKEYAEQLTKAKEIIKDLLNLPFASNEEVFADVGSHLEKAEQFIKDLEK